MTCHLFPDRKAEQLAASSFTTHLAHGGICHRLKGHIGRNGGASPVDRYWREKGSFRSSVWGAAWSYCRPRTGTSLQSTTSTVCITQIACCLPHPTILNTICTCAPEHSLPAPVPTQPLPLHYRSPPQPIHPTPLNHSADRLPSAPAPLVPQPYPVHGLPEGSNFTRSDVAQQIRRSFDALVKASPIGTPMVGRRLCACMTGCPMAAVCAWSPCD
jgi:hypothetical protein